MRRTRGWTWVVAVCLVLAGATASYAVPPDRMELVAAYNAIFTTDVVVVEPTDPYPVEPVANIYCCAASAACVQTSADKCTKAVADGGYGGTVHNSYLECKRAGCT